MIEASGRAALRDLRRMLDAMSDPRQGAALTPAPGLLALEELIDLHRKAHGPVQLRVDTALAGETDSLRLTAYRLVQEALTNVAKHARGAPATVQLDMTGDGVLVVVENEAPRPSRAEPIPRWSGSGFGLAGMRERVAVFGGELVAAETAAGGFRVRAELPRQARA